MQIVDWLRRELKSLSEYGERSRPHRKSHESDMNLQLLLKTTNKSEKKTHTQYQQFFQLLHKMRKNTQSTELGREKKMKRVFLEHEQRCFKFNKNHVFTQEVNYIA